MELVHELLQKESSENLRFATKLLTYSVLQSASEQSKHKLKTRISALLKSTGVSRAYGAVLARRALRDWSTVKSHGHSWSTILLHALDLPDQVCWKPVTTTLTVLFVAVSDKPELAREIAGSRIGDFAKRLIATLPVTKLYSCVGALVQHYPTQFRPYIDKLFPQVDVRVQALFCISEKSGIEVWNTRVSELLTSILQFADAAAENHPAHLASQLHKLRCYLEVAPKIRAKVPSRKIWTSLYKLLKTLDSVTVTATCCFIQRTWPILKPLYILKFDDLAYQLVEIMDMGVDESIEAAKVLDLLIYEVGWVSEKYSQLFTRVQKTMLHRLGDKYQPLGVNGLADFVQHPNVFKTETISPENRQALLDFVTKVSTRVSGIPQSVRVRTDKVILQYGSHDNLAQATLYPAKHSILPLTIAKLPTLNGIESLVHPRLPPLNASRRSLDALHKQDDTEDYDHNLKTDEQSIDSQSFNESKEPGDIEDNEISEISENIVSKDSPLPSQIPASRTRSPQETPKSCLDKEGSAPPEKKAKVEHSEQINTVSTAKSNDKEHGQDDTVHDQDDDDDLVIPTLTLDSD